MTLSIPKELHCRPANFWLIGFWSNGLEPHFCCFVQVRFDANAKNRIMTLFLDSIMSFWSVVSSSWSGRNQSPSLKSPTLVDWKPQTHIFFSLRSKSGSQKLDQNIEFFYWFLGQMWVAIYDNTFCRSSLQLASSRWISLTLSSLCPLAFKQSCQ